MWRLKSCCRLGTHPDRGTRSCRACTAAREPDCAPSSPRAQGAKPPREPRRIILWTPRRLSEPEAVGPGAARWEMVRVPYAHAVGRYGCDAPSGCFPEWRMVAPGTSCSRNGQPREICWAGFTWQSEASGRESRRRLAVGWDLSTSRWIIVRKSVRTAAVVWLSVARESAVCWRATRSPTEHSLKATPEALRDALRGPVTRRHRFLL